LILFLYAIELDYIYLPCAAATAPLRYREAKPGCRACKPRRTIALPRIWIRSDQEPRPPCAAGPVHTGTD